jgi:ubiquinone biosynthesis protein
VEYDDPPAVQALERDVADFMGRHLYKPLKEIEIGKVLHELLDLLFRHRLKIPQDLFIMFKALTTWEGVGLSMDRDFHIMERAAPLVERMRMARMHPGRIADEIWESGVDLLELLRDIPSELREILLQVKQGKVKMTVEHGALEPMLTSQDRSSNRIAFSIITAALIIGSALIVLAKTPPFLFGFPLIGIIGFVVAAIMTGWLIIRS